MYAYSGKQTNTIPAEAEGIKKVPSQTGLSDKIVRYSSYQEGVFRWLNFWI